MAMVLEKLDLDMRSYLDQHTFEALDADLYGNPQLALRPKVSVCIISYQHEAYIATCLDSILSQQVNFEFEIILGEDHSSDKTPQIIQQYADAHPQLIKAFVRPRNVTAKRNFLHCFLQARGEYIIYIEGDDYWTDVQKLQKQVDFLDQHPDASACFHNAEIVFEDGSGRKNQLINGPEQAIWTHTQDFFKEKETWFMATASVMMRRKWVNPLPEWFMDCKSGDIPMYVILSEKGPIGYLPDVMSVYRKNLGGQSFTDSTQSKDFLQNRIFMYATLNAYTNRAFEHLIHPILSDYHELLIHCREFQGNFFPQLIHFYWAYRLRPSQSFKMLLKRNLISERTLSRYGKLRSKLNQWAKR